MVCFEGLYGHSGFQGPAMPEVEANGASKQTDASMRWEQN